MASLRSFHGVITRSNGVLIGDCLIRTVLLLRSLGFHGALAATAFFGLSWSSRGDCVLWAFMELSRRSYCVYIVLQNVGQNPTSQNPIPQNFVVHSVKLKVWGFVHSVKFRCGVLSTLLNFEMWGFDWWGFVRVSYTRYHWFWIVVYLLQLHASKQYFSLLPHHPLLKGHLLANTFYIYTVENLY
jgi:hypothetical protein